MSHNSTDNIIVRDYRLTVKAKAPPVRVSEFKQFARITTEDFDSSIAALIKSVTKIAENITGRDLINKTYKGYLDCFPCSQHQGIEIRRSKLQSITSIQYLKEMVLTTFDSSNYYFTDKQEFSTIYLEEDKLYPLDVDNKRQAVEILFVAGYGDDSCDIPEDFKQAILSHINLLHKNLGDCPEDKSISDQAAELYAPYIVSTKQVCII